MVATSRRDSPFYDSSPRAASREQGRKNRMLDLIFAGATVLFVVVAVAYVHACDRLRVK